MLTDTQANELWERISDIPVGMMATWDDGSIRARPMHTVQKEFSGKLWFFTDIRAAKTDEIEQTREVGISYEDTHKQLYVSVSGVARITRDRALIDKFWNSMVGAWFPEGKGDANIAMIEVDVYQAELWDAKRNRMSQLFNVALANARNQRPDVGEHRQFNSH